MLAHVMRLLWGGEARSDSNLPEHVVVFCRDPHIRDLITSWLRQAKFDVERVATGDEARWSLAKKQYQRHALVTDREALSSNALPSVAKLRLEISGLRMVVVQVASQDPDVLVKAVGADAGITRPLYRAALLEAIRYNQ